MWWFSDSANWQIFRKRCANPTWRIFVRERDGSASTIEKVVPCSWVPDTFLAVLGDELFMMIVKGSLSEWSSRYSWPPLSSLDLLCVEGIEKLLEMANQYREMIPLEFRHQGQSAVYVVSRSAVLRWQIRVTGDKHTLAIRTADSPPAGHAFVDAGWCRPPLNVVPRIAPNDLQGLVEYIGARSSGLVYEVGTGITGIVLPHDPTRRPTGRCISELSLKERTPKLSAVSAGT